MCSLGLSPGLLYSDAIQWGQMHSTINDSKNNGKLLLLWMALTIEMESYWFIRFKCNDWKHSENKTIGKKIQHLYRYSIRRDLISEINKIHSLNSEHSVSVFSRLQLKLLLHPKQSTIIARILSNNQLKDAVSLPWH